MAVTSAAVSHRSCCTGTRIFQGHGTTSAVSRTAQRSRREPPGTIVRELHASGARQLTSHQQRSRGELLQENHTLASEASREKDKDSSGGDAAAELGGFMNLRGAFGLHIVPSVKLGGFRLGLDRLRRQAANKRNWYTLCQL